MKKILTAVMLCMFAIGQAQSKKEVSLKLYYAPQSIYTITQNATMNMNMTYSGDEDVMAALEENGMENPTVISNTSQSVIEFSTGKLNKNKEFPTQMRFVSSTNENLNKYFKPNTIIYGHGTEDAFPVFDSISDKSFNKDFSQSFLQTMQSVLSQIKYPETKLKVGETASMDTPMSMPVAGTTMDIKLTTTYKLLSIKGNIAEYDMSMVATIAADIEGYNMEIHGGGSGKMTYDTAVNYYKSYVLDIDMQMQMAEEDFTMVIRLLQKIDATATVEKRK